MVEEAYGYVQGESLKPYAALLVRLLNSPIARWGRIGMSDQQSNEVRRGVTQANFNQQYGGILLFEIFVVAIFAGSYFSSWVVGGGIFLGGFVLVAVDHRFAMALGVALGLSWGITGWFIGTMFDDKAASFVLAIIFVLMGVGANNASANWLRDLN